MAPYRGRLAPSPTGYLHLGHARTFWVAWRRARAAHGKLIFRNEDLDYQRCKPEFVRAMYEDLRWLGLDWDEGPELSFDHSGHGDDDRSDRGGPFGPYSQSERRSFYLDAWRKLRDTGLIYPCTCSRKDLERALSAPHEENDYGAQAPSPANPQGSPAQPGAPLPQQAKSRPVGDPWAAVHSPPDDELPYPGTCREK
ncbi:MAG TPA: glutamate--tRNA ligase family protein, partial [Alphaproteobacteria bacterium]|nr:glutamate--tRNA ligase family protein [Alphaproteobacteria bacterium]